MRPLLLGIAVLAAGCGVVLTEPDDAGRHADVPLPADPDSATPIDTGDLPDSSATDGDPLDAGTTDLSSDDADVADSGVFHTLTINLVGPGRIDSTPSGITCGATCTASFESGAPIELTATPDTNARIVGWSAPCESASDECSFTLVEDRTITVELEIRPPIVTSGQAADLVLGQADFTTTAVSDPLNGSSLDFPVQCATFGSRLWVADTQHHRILQWDAEPFLNHQSANIAIGQQNLLSANESFSRTGISEPADMSSDGQRLFVGNGPRVLIFDPIPSNFSAAAALVIGQTDFVSNVGGTSASQFQSSTGIHVADGRLFVADFSNSRVLIWNQIPTSSGLHAADVVLGQPDFTTVMTGPASSSSLKYPSDVFYDLDSGKLVVADTNNNRVLIWNSLPTTNGAPADVVVGQSAFNVALQNAGATVNQFGLAQPRSVTIAHGALFVSDFANQRVMVWQPIPTSNGEPATAVLGRADFSETGNPAAGPTKLSYPNGVCVLDDSLYVTSGLWNRVTRFQLDP